MKRGLLLLLCVMQSFIFVLHAQNTQRNIAYTDGNVRFTVISDGAIRLEYAPDGKFVDDRSHIVVNRNYPQVDYKLKTRGGWVEITTSKMKMRYKKKSGQFTDKNLVITASKEILPFTWKPGMQQKGNLKGTYRTLDGMDGDTQTQTWVADTKKGDKLKLEDGLLATDGWTLIDDSQGLLFDDNKDWDWVKERPANGGQDWYFMAYGHDYKAALKDYTLFAGKVPLPPRYAFGYWWSRYWLYSDREFRNLIDNFHTYQIPLDVLVVDMDWHYTEQGKGGWTGWTWNRDLFPNPKEFLGYLKQNDVKIKDGTDVNSIMRDMMSVILEGALDEELDEELGYSKYDYHNKDTANSRNGHSQKTLHTSYGDMGLDIPRDRAGEFEPQVIKKYQNTVT